MKKLLSMLLVMLMLIGIFSSCNANNMDTNSNTATETDKITNLGSNTDSDTSNDSNIDTNINAELYEKYGNNVYFTHEQKDTYYPEIREYEEVSNCFDIPLDADGFKKTGAYLKFIETYDELLTYIVPTELDSSIYNSNYVVCVKQYFYNDAHEKRLIGYYDLACSDGKYIISLDYYKSVDQVPHEQESKPYEFTTYIIVPQNSVIFTEYLQQITVNGRNDIEDEIYVDDEGGLISGPIKSSHGYITHNASADLPENSTAWVVEKGSELEKFYGLEYYNKYSKIEFRVVLYLPSEPKCDFIITDKEIKNGNLYLTVEEYSQYENEYLNENDVKFYDLYIQDTSELAENFDVYLLIKSINMNTDTSINTNDNSTNSSDINNNNTSSSTQDILDTSIQVEYDAEREAKDNEFPFDNIVIERNGYDIVAAGKYYGSDFDNVKYYGSYYRMIDNYEDFSELTQWGKQLDETVFDENFVLVLYSYTNCSVYYSHSEFNVLNWRGQFWDFDVDLRTGKPEITEIWSVGGGVPDVNGYIPPKMEEHTIIFPTEKQETIYLLIPKDEMPNNLPINGEIELKSQIIELE